MVKLEFEGKQPELSKTDLKCCRVYEIVDNDDKVRGIVIPLSQEVLYIKDGNISWGSEECFNDKVLRDVTDKVKIKVEE